MADLKWEVSGIEGEKLFMLVWRGSQEDEKFKSFISKLEKMDLKSEEPRLRKRHRGYKNAERYPIAHTLHWWPAIYEFRTSEEDFERITIKQYYNFKNFFALVCKVQDDGYSPEVVNQVVKEMQAE